MRTSKHSGEKKVSAKGGKRTGYLKGLLESKLKDLGLGRPGAAMHLDPDDAPVLTEEFFERADVYDGNKLVRAGRPPSTNPKQALKLRIDPDVVAYFRATGPGWQTRINDTLRKAAKLPTKRDLPVSE